MMRLRQRCIRCDRELNDLGRCDFCEPPPPAPRPRSPAERTANLVGNVVLTVAAILLVLVVAHAAGFSFIGWVVGLAQRVKGGLGP